jgi:hypothetical protein
MDQPERFWLFWWVPCAWSGLVRHVAKHRELQTMESLLTVWVQECLYKYFISGICVVACGWLELSCGHDYGVLLDTTVEEKDGLTVYVKVGRRDGVAEMIWAGREFGSWEV